MADGSEKVLNYKNCRTEGPESAKIWTFGATEAGTGGEGHQVYHHFCTICGLQTFTVGRLDFMGGAFVGINLNLVENWDENGLDIKDVTDVKKMSYINGISDWAAKKGEPWPKQAW